jgi:hypothetical protein
MRKPLHRFALSWLLFLLSACLPTRTPEPSPEAISLLSTATSQPSLTPTVVWFPPTATYTPIPTRAVTPTPDRKPGIGEQLLSDDFTDAKPWQLGRTAEGSLALGKGELTIAIASPKAYLFSVRQEPVLDDFYAEITASPNLCRGLDEYGILVRFSAPASYYRFSLSCDGQVRLDRVVSGQASSPQTWLPSGTAPPGAPSSSVLGVWAVGNEMRFFVSGEYQFSVTDPVLPSGRLGVFARSAGDTAVTVNFSSLVVYQVSVPTP